MLLTLSALLSHLRQLRRHIPSRSFESSSHSYSSHPHHHHHQQKTSQFPSSPLSIEHSSENLSKESFCVIYAGVGREGNLVEVHFQPGETRWTDHRRHGHGGKPPNQDIAPKTKNEIRKQEKDDRRPGHRFRPKRLSLITSRERDATHFQTESSSRPRRISASSEFSFHKLEDLIEELEFEMDYSSSSAAAARAPPPPPLSPSSTLASAPNGLPMILPPPRRQRKLQLARSRSRLMSSSSLLKSAAESDWQRSRSRSPPRLAFNASFEDISRPTAFTVALPSFINSTSTDTLLITPQTQTQTETQSQTSPTSSSSSASTTPPSANFELRPSVFLREIDFATESRLREARESERALKAKWDYYNLPKEFGLDLLAPATPTPSSMSVSVSAGAGTEAHAPISPISLSSLVSAPSPALSHGLLFETGSDPSDRDKGKGKTRTSYDSASVYATTQTQPGSDPSPRHSFATSSRPLSLLSSVDSLAVLGGRTDSQVLNFIEMDNKTPNNIPEIGLAITTEVAASLPFPAPPPLSYSPLFYGHAQTHPYFRSPPRSQSTSDPRPISLSFSSESSPSSHFDPYSIFGSSTDADVEVEVEADVDSATNVSSPQTDIASSSFTSSSYHVPISSSLSLSLSNTSTNSYSNSADADISHSHSRSRVRTTSNLSSTSTSTSFSPRSSSSSAGTFSLFRLSTEGESKLEQARRLRMDLLVKVVEGADARARARERGKGGDEGST